MYEVSASVNTPVVTDMKEADNALRWCVGEMGGGTVWMAAMGVRNLTGIQCQDQRCPESRCADINPLWRAQDHALDNEPQPELDISLSSLSSMNLLT